LQICGEFGDEPRLADARGPRDEHDPSVSPAGLPPRSAKPSELVLPIREWHRVVELRRERLFHGLPFVEEGCGLPRGVGLEQLSRPIEALELDSPT
jgi:hypothetical protein